jgi:hypothetical protein
MENNKLIAEFMGAEIEENYKQYPWTWDDDYPNPRIRIRITLPLDTLPKSQKFGVYYVEGLQYHTDWNWLMPVVEKIDLILPDDNLVTISFNRCLIEWFEKGITFEGLGNTRIEATYKAVVEFIIFYNENK